MFPSGLPGIGLIAVLRSGHSRRPKKEKIMHAKTSPMAGPQIAAVRGFNRLFTRIIATPPRKTPHLQADRALASRLALVLRTPRPSSSRKPTCW
jgi:hypothetical protein